MPNQHSAFKPLFSGIWMNSSIIRWALNAKCTFAAMFTSLVLHQPLHADITNKVFYEAVSAVESRNYVAFNRLLDKHPKLMSYAASPQCTLYCELVNLARRPMPEDFLTEVDERALRELIGRRADPSLSKNLLRDMLAYVNRLKNSEADLPVATGDCTEVRNRMFPLINDLVELRANVGEADGLRFSLSFLYVHQLCHVAYVCGAPYERVPSQALSRISDNLNASEVVALRRLTSEGSLGKQCVEQFEEF
ncbi:hypothetical protein [Tateyamaria sp. ANG-S1]|uniref:hypothetical protein n=1 Tax=Tateyamaria sp. ANG-S1 TaxID=1577905 RepID=UPI00187CD16D|nr:hypothetical protein [Tateyamaria sp. ANG-S1]